MSAASGERTFSRLKLIKNYLRSAMTQDRLNSLAIMSIERSKEIGIKNILEEFKEQKLRNL